ncbi:MAG: hypothetical protein ACTHMR_21320, partial [Thermomicrobiales bacterium]
NAIVRFTSQERIWLEDADYDKVAANFHNTLIVTRDGESGVLPPYARLDTIVSASRVALAESTVLDVGGSDWTRTILWVRALGFVVVDRVVARQAGEFDLRCLWRTVGDAKLVDDQTWRITMVPASLNIVAAPPPTANWSVEEIEEPYVRVTWPTYPYAGPNVRVLRQGVTAPLAAGEECVLVSFLLDGDRPAMVRRDEQGWVHGRVGERDFRLWLGGQSLAVSGAPAGLTARLLYADQDDLVAVGLTGAGAGQFSGAWERSEGALVAAHRASAWSSADDAGWRDTLAALDQALAAQSAEETAPTATAPQAPSGTPATAQGRELWRIEGLARGPVAVADLDNDGSDEVLVGTSDGTLLAYRAGERLWAQRTPAAVTALGCGDVDGDGLPEIIVGQAEGVVELRDADGTPRWQQEFPPHMGHPATVRAAFTGQLNPAGPPAVLIATESCHVQAYTADGQPLWRYEVVHAATTACAADVNGDGRDEVLAASEYWSWHAIQPDGTALFRVRGVESSGAAAVGTCRRPGTGQRLALFGGWDGHLTAYTPDGERAWDVPLGDIITTAEGVDFDGQGEEEILVAARSG